MRTQGRLPYIHENPVLPIRVVFLLPHTKITSALTVSVTAVRRAFILFTHSIWLSDFSVSVMPSRFARCSISRFQPVIPSREYNNRPATHTKDRFARYRYTVPLYNPPKSYIRTYITVSRLPHSFISCYEIFLPLLLPLSCAGVRVKRCEIV